MSESLEKANKKQKQIIKKALGNPNLTKSQLQQVRNIVIQTRSLDYCQKLAKKLPKPNGDKNAADKIINIINQMQ